MKTKNYAVVIIAVWILLVSIHACSKSGTTTQAPNGENTKIINISGMAFPASITVTKGISVIWFNADGFTHTVTSDDGTSFNSGNIVSKASFKYVANKAGTFTYHCNIHAGMTGNLTVTP